MDLVGLVTGRVQRAREGTRVLDLFGEPAESVKHKTERNSISLHPLFFFFFDVVVVVVKVVFVECPNSRFGNRTVYVADQTIYKTKSESEIIRRSLEPP